jgi:hypothetical protein
MLQGPFSIITPFVNIGTETLSQMMNFDFDFKFTQVTPEYPSASYIVRLFQQIRDRLLELADI